MGEVVDLSEAFMATLDEKEPSHSVVPSTESEEVSKLSAEAELTREMLVNAQQMTRL